jgi:hypothetical protein
MAINLSGTTMVAAATLARTPHIHRAGALDVRLATTEEEIRAAQTLRYDIFYNEMGAVPTAETLKLARDYDPYDAMCDHLLVIDHSHENAPRVVGTYRLLREIVAKQNQGFYSASEYDLSPLAKASNCWSLAARASTRTIAIFPPSIFCGAALLLIWPPTILASCSAAPHSMAPMPMTMPQLSPISTTIISPMQISVCALLPAHMSI